MEALPPRQIPTLTYAEIHDQQVRNLMAAQMLYEFGSGDKKERCHLGIASFCFFSSLLFSILYYIFGSQPSINSIGTDCSTSEFQSMGGGVSTCTGSIEGYYTVPISCGTFEFVQVHTKQDCLMLSCLIPLNGLCSPGGLRLTR